MVSITTKSVRLLVMIAAVAACLLAAGQAAAFPSTLSAWQDRYGAISASGDNARCQLCHVESNGGSPWNGYGWDIRDALVDAACDLDSSGTVSNAEALFCVELDNSDLDGSGYDNIAEIGVGTQPGWTNGPFNIWYDRTGTTTGNGARHERRRRDTGGTGPRRGDPVR